MKKLGLIRDGRSSVIEFYKYYTQFEIEYISAGLLQKTPFKNLPPTFHIHTQKPVSPLLIDPIEKFFPHRNNLFLRYYQNMEKILSTCDIICISDTYYLWNLQAIQIAKRLHIPIVTSIWCNIPHHITTFIPPYSYVTKQVVQNTNLFILRTKKAKQFTDSLQIPPHKTVQIYKGIDTEKFSPSLKEKNPKQIKLLFVGRIEEAKGIFDIVKVFEQLHQKYPSITLTIAGTGPQEQKLLSLLTHPSITYLGQVSYQNLPHIYQSADIFISPSKTQKLLNILETTNEYLSYTVMEALSSGLPIIVSNIGGNPEAVGNENYCIPEGDIDQLYKAIQELITDSAKRIALGQKNRSRALQYFDAKKQASISENAMLALLKKDIVL